MKYLVSKKGRWLYYALQFTLGILPNFVALLIILFNVIFKKKKLHKHAVTYYMEIGKENWGGLSLGMFSFISPYAGLHTKNHEMGHALQNAVLSIFMIPLVQIPSFIRYHYRNIKIKKGIPLTTDYDSVWFEGTASRLGWTAYEEYYKIDEQ